MIFLQIDSTGSGWHSQLGETIGIPLIIGLLVVISVLVYNRFKSKRPNF